MDSTAASWVVAVVAVALLAVLASALRACAEERPAPHRPAVIPSPVVAQALEVTRHSWERRLVQPGADWTVASEGLAPGDRMEEARKRREALLVRVNEALAPTGWRAVINPDGVLSYLEDRG